MSKDSLLVFNNFTADLKITSLWLRKGALFDPPGKEGLAHLSEHLFLRRTLKYEKLMEYLDSNYLIYNAYTDKELVYFYFLHPLGKEELAKSILEDCRDNIYVTDEELEKEKGIIINEQGSAEKNRIVQINRLADKNTWGYLYSRPILGTKETISSISKRDIKNFRMQENKSIKLDINIKEIMSGKVDGLVTVAVTYPFSKVTTLKDCVILDFISEYLSGGWASRLIKRMRIENNYAYWPTSKTEFLSETGYLRVYYSVQSKDLQDTLDILRNEIELLKDKAIVASDLELQKNIFEFKLKEKLSNIYTYVRWFGIRSNYFGMSGLEDYIRISEKLNSEDVRETAEKNLKKFSVTLLGS